MNSLRRGWADHAIPFVAMVSLLVLGLGMMSGGLSPPGIHVTPASHPAGRDSGRVGVFTPHPGPDLESAAQTGPPYNVTFAETGLPAGTNWSVTLNGTTLSSTNATVNFTEDNGTYGYSITPVAGYSTTYTGQVMVNGASITQDVTFTQVTYTVTFTETGLPTGTSWSITMNGVEESSSTASIVFTEPNGTYSYSITPIPGYSTAYTGEVTVNGASITQDVTFTLVTYTVTFAETGLPSGTSWSITMNGAEESSSTASIAFTEPNGTYSYSITPIPGYTTTYTGQVTVNGASITQDVTFVTAKYTVTFTETGLPSGTNWSVTLNGLKESSSTASIAFDEPNGTFGYSITPIAGYSTTYSGEVTVNGASITQDVTFTQVTYSVTFTETGLPSGTSWSVTLNGTTQSSTTSAIAFTEPNGTFGYSINPIPGYSTTYSGQVTVNGASVSKGVTFTRVTYTLTFTETGLPSGTSWSVTLNGAKETSSTTSITFTEPNGTYPYSITPIAGYSTTYSGQVVVNGASISKGVTFTQVTYTVTFTETGLPSGKNWSVTLNGVTLSSTTKSIVFAEPNGTYTFTVGTTSGYKASPSTGPLTVNGAAQSQTVSYSSTSSSPSVPVAYLILGALVAIVAVLGGVVLWIRHKRAPKSP
jgi:hypothetical protein